MSRTEVTRPRALIVTLTGQLMLLWLAEQAHAVGRHSTVDLAQWLD